MDILDLEDEGSKIPQNTSGYLTIKAVPYPKRFESYCQLVLIYAGLKYLLVRKYEYMKHTFYIGGSAKEENWTGSTESSFHTVLDTIH